MWPANNGGRLVAEGEANGETRRSEEPTDRNRGLEKGGIEGAKKASN